MSIRRGSTVASYTLQKHLGYFNHIFRLSQLHQCGQGMLPNWKSFFNYNRLIRPIFLHSWHSISQTMQPRNSGHADVRSKQQHTSPEMLIYKFLETRGQHLNYTLFNCKHSLNFACHAHKGNATEVTKIWLK